MPKFEVVPDEERQRVSDGRKRPGPLLTALREGKTVFVPNEPGGGYAPISNLYTAFRKSNKRLVSHRTERDGVPGILMWVTHQEENES